MSATYDKNQKVTFVFSQFPERQRKTMEAAGPAVATAVASSEVQQGHVLKAADARETPVAIHPRRVVQAYQAPHFLNRHVVRKPEALSPLAQKSNPAVESLKQNLKSLNELHSRLRFMLEELEDLVKE